jgi:alpha-L-fucosidase
MKNLLISITILFSICVFTGRNTSAQSFELNWESLHKQSPAPEWLKDAKFGIYFHWGVYSVPAFGNEWYPRTMNIDGTETYKYHSKTYGHPSQFGYHDFVPMFKAEHFNAEEWVALFKKAGARFAGPVAEHHDGFSMWDSDITPWNTMKKGPEIDITGELEKEIRRQNMKLITTFHHARNLQRKRSSNGLSSVSHYPYLEGLPTYSTDPELRLLYGNVPEDEWNEKIWFGKLKEVIDKYQPDLIYFDSWLNLIPEDLRYKFCEYYLDDAKKRGKEVGIIRKQNDLPLEVSIDDLEKSRKNELADELWMTDETVSTGSWCYTEDLKIKESADLLHVLIDIVSKNGVLLLNISPKADGTIPEEQKGVLLDIGGWLGKYGDAIYETRPWYTFGEGPTKEPKGHFDNAEKFLKLKYTNKDIRYTSKGNKVYAIVLGKPETSKEIVLSSFEKEKLPKGTEISSVKMLGSGKSLDWTSSKTGLTIKVPKSIPNEPAVVFEIEIK